MPSHIVDLSARSQVFRAQPLLSHAWVASPADVLTFLRNPRSELKKLGLRLPSSCRIETVLQNHDWLSGHSDGLEKEGRVTVFFRGEGDGQSFYRVSLFASKATETAPERELLHGPEEEEKPTRRTSKLARARVDASRRSMLAAPLHTTVHKWLSPLTLNTPSTKSTDEAHRIFAGITHAVARLLAHKPAIEAARNEIAGLLQRSFHPSYSLLFRAHRSSSTTLHGAFTGVMYAKALWMLRTSGWHYDALVEDVGRLLEDPGPALRILSDALRSLDVDFIAHATVEATIRRRADALFDDRLAEAEQMFERHHPAHPARCPHFCAHAKGLERFASTNASEWWFLPGLVAFAISVWPEGARSNTAQMAT